MANKFLGINSINVIKDYIDKRIDSNNDKTTFVTIHAYRYTSDNDGRPETPTNGEYDYEGAKVIYPEGWSSLKSVTDTLGEVTTAGGTPNYEKIDEALSVGSIWLSVGIAESNNTTDTIEWSTPMKISGQNGVSVRFAYSYDPNATEDQRTNTPTGVNSKHRTEYVWTKYADDAWQGPTIWATYAVDATIVIWRYCLSTGIDESGLPLNPTPWFLDIPSMSMNSEYPYMWMSYKIIPAKETIITEEQSNINNSENSGWSTPVVFGHYAKDGENGTLPDYNINIYRLGEGLYAPEKPVWEENISVEDFRANNPEWVDLPQKTGEGTEIWWQCTAKVNGKTNEILHLSDVYKYNAIDGTALPGQFTKYEFCWSTTQSLPENPEWTDKPTYVESDNEGSLWMRLVTAQVVDGELQLLTDWSDPIKLTGPRGPIAYDYRLETRYNIGTETRPVASPTEEEWSKNVPEVTSQNPYVWAVNYLVLYTMKYDEDGKVVPADEGKLLESYSYFRISGINGEDGNRKNSLKYFTSSEEIDVTSFSENNLYISNSADSVVYNIKLDQLSFINGYTGKFANIGTGSVTINSGNFVFAGSGVTTTTLKLAPQETVELVCYNNGNSKELLVIGKALA